MPLFRNTVVLISLFLCLINASGAIGAAKHGVARPESHPKIRAAAFRPVDAVIEEAIAQHQIPGAVLLVGHNGKVVYRRAYGMRSLDPRREPMTVETIFDVASLTKPIATATSVMRLVELGKIRLNDPIARYIPEFGENGKDQITIRQLLTHYSGLREDLDLAQPWSGKETAFRMIAAENPIAPPGAHWLYSDINFEMLGFLVEKVSGMTLNEYAQRNIFQPLGMAHTGFLPPAAWTRSIAPTGYYENKMLRGVVHDPTARRMGGVAGHAGLFSTASDLARYAQAMLDRRKILAPLTIEKMTTPQQPPTATRLVGLGWDIDTPFSSNRGELLPVGSFGHTGFTGVSLWIDPYTRTYIILMTNAVHPRGATSGNGKIALRAKVANAVTSALRLTLDAATMNRIASITGYNEAATGTRRPVGRNGKVLNGIDVLEAENFSPLGGKDSAEQVSEEARKRRIGLLTNQTGIDLEGRRTIDVLAHASGIQLAALFSPEHGATGKLDTTDAGDTTDAATGIPVYSVYGATEAARRPPAEVLKKLDAVVVDLQDAGARFYTYETTLGYFLEEAAKAGVEVVVLDRPNPVSGSVAQGPVSDTAQAFINYHPLPARHGLTMGELAKLFNQERNIGARLTVVPMRGWMRGDWFDSTGQMWVNPSPNMRNLNAAALYSGIAMVEFTNLSVGRGTDAPFEMVGAPWIKARELAEYLNARQISGVRFVPTLFTPNAGIFANQECGGVRIIITDRLALDSPELGLEVASALLKLYPKDFHSERIVELLANRAAFAALIAGEDPRRIADEWRDGLEKFEALKKKYVIY